MKKLIAIMALAATSLACVEYGPGSCCQAYGNGLPLTEGTESYQKGKKGGSKHSLARKSKERKGVDEDEIQDAKLAEQVYHKLSESGLQLVFVDVRGGVVTLRGSVDSGEKKLRIDLGLKEVEGIKNVHNQVEVKKPSGSAAYLDAQLKLSEKKYPRDTAATQADRILNAKIRDKISGSWLAPLNEALVLKTKNGFVAVMGTAYSQEDIQSVDRYISLIDGVKSVDNQVKFKP